MSFSRSPFCFFEDSDFLWLRFELDEVFLSSVVVVGFASLVDVFFFFFAGADVVDEDDLVVDVVDDLVVLLRLAVIAFIVRESKAKSAYMGFNLRSRFPTSLSFLRLVWCVEWLLEEDDEGDAVVVVVVVVVATTVVSVVVSVGFSCFTSVVVVLSVLWLVLVL